MGSLGLSLPVLLTFACLGAMAQEDEMPADRNDYNFWFTRYQKLQLYHKYTLTGCKPVDQYPVPNLDYMIALTKRRKTVTLGYHAFINKCIICMPMTVDGGEGVTCMANLKPTLLAHEKEVEMRPWFCLADSPTVKVRLPTYFIGGFNDPVTGDEVAMTFYDEWMAANMFHGVLALEKGYELSC